MKRSRGEVLVAFNPETKQSLVGTVVTASEDGACQLGIPDRTGFTMNFSPSGREWSGLFKGWVLAVPASEET